MAVVGGGIIGLAVAYHLTLSNVKVTLIDRDPEGDKTSIGNAGAIAVTEVVPASTPSIFRRIPGWMCDPLGPLSIRPRHAIRLIPWLIRFARAGSPQEVDCISTALAAINERVYADFLPMLSDIGMPDALRRNGALTLYETDEGYRSDESDWARKRSFGIAVEHVTGAEARDLEPALGPLVRRAVFTPQWSHVADPRLILEGLRRWLRFRGVSIRRAEVQSIEAQSASPVAVDLVGGTLIGTDRVVIAAGAWSAMLAKRLGDHVLLESERGYNATLPHPGIKVERQLIFGERKFVATPLNCGLRIGGAAEFGGLNAPANYRRAEVLVGLAARYLPGLQMNGATTWAGHRPATPDSLPVISRSVRNDNVFYAFGHGHLGLTQAATTGRLMSDLILQHKPAIDLSPYDIRRFR